MTDSANHTQRRAGFGDDTIMETKQFIASLTEDPVSPLGLEQIFCGRNSELAVLKQQLLGPAPKTVCITGVGGIGKTALASMFAEQNREAFPAGVWFVSANQVEPVDETVGRDVQESRSPCLIVIDYLDVRPQERITLELAAMRHRHPSARVLAISRQTISSSSIDLQLAIGGLSQ